MATNNYIQMQIISRNMDLTYSGGNYTKVSILGKLTPLTNIDVASSENTHYASLPNAGNSETWYGIKFGSYSAYSKTNYAPFGVQNLQLEANESGLKFVIDLVHTETNGSSNTYETKPFLRQSANYGKFIHTPFNSVINGWVSITENNVIKVYVSNTNETYFDQLSSAYRTQLLIQIIGHWETATTTYTITDITTNCSGDNTQTSIEGGQTYTNTFTPNDGYAFHGVNKPNAVCAGVVYDSVINADGTATITISNVNGNIELTGGAIRKYNLNLELYNCVLYDGNNPYGLDYVLEGETYHFILHSNANFIFKTFPRWNMGSETGDFALSTIDKTIARISWHNYQYIIIDNNLRIQANATLSPSLKYGFVSIYNPTYDELDELSRKRFYSPTQGEFIDLSEYIISLRKLYVEIPQITRELVFFGKYNTNISANIVTSDIIETDCGRVVVNELNANSLDYNGVEIELYLPFIGTISLNPNQVYGKRLNLYYRTNPLNGDCVALLFSDGVQIAYSQGNVSFDVPINFKYGNLNNYGTNDNALYMASTTPYIEIKTNRQYQNMNNRLLNNNLWVQISDCAGYVEFSEIQFNQINKINNDEYNEIINLLQNGIIV